MLYTETRPGNYSPWEKKLFGLERDIVLADVLFHYEIWSKESWDEELLKLTANLEAKQWD